MVWDLMTIHGSELNTTDSQRMTFMSGFAKAECALDWPMYEETIDYTKIP